MPNRPSASQKADSHLSDYTFLTEDTPDREFPEEGMSPQQAMRLVDEDLVLEGDPWRNLATFCHHLDGARGAEADR